MHTLRATLPIASFAVLCAFAPLADSPRFSVAEKAHLTKHFTSTTKLTIESMNVRVDGEDQAQELPKVELSTERELVVTDEYVTVEKGGASSGRPTKLARTFDTIESKSSVHVDGEKEEDGDQTGKSKLAKRSVLFTWDADAKKYEAEFRGEKGDDDLLEGLDADLDLLAFLPDKAVKEKDEWQIDAASLGVFVMPGGDLHVVSDDEEDGTGFGAVSKTVREHLKGKVKATYRGERTADGTKCGVIAFEGDVESTGDFVEDEEKTTVVAKLSIEGELLWDLEAGHFHSVKATSKAHLSMSGKSEIEMDEGKTAAVEQELVLDGTIEVSGTVDG